MTWPTSEAVNAALREPGKAFADPELAGGRVTATPIGVPLPRSGNYADVYQVTSPSGRVWAVKCFHKPVGADLGARYAAIGEELTKANLPFTVPLEYQAAGLRVGAAAVPIVKMQWVEGQPLNVFVKANLNQSAHLEAMLSLWVRLCRRLRESGMAHCDIQHGNALLVPGERANALGLKLVDYDGFFVPALAGKPTGEPGHPSYQHPQRVATNNYSADLDRFPHLVVATALRALLVGGLPLWNEFDTGDNLIFTASDFTTPHKSKAMRKLWAMEDPFTTGLLAHLVIATSKPLPATPWLDSLMPEGRAPVLTPSQERLAMQLLGLADAAPKPAAKPVPVAPAEPAAELNFEEESTYTPRARPKPAGSKLAPLALVLLGGGLVFGAAFFYFKGKTPPIEVASAASAAPKDDVAKAPSASAAPKEKPAKTAANPELPAVTATPPTKTESPMNEETPMVAIAPKPMVVEVPKPALAGRRHPDKDYATATAALQKEIDGGSLAPAVAALQKLTDAYYLPPEAVSQFQSLCKLPITTDDQARTLLATAYDIDNNLYLNFDARSAVCVADVQQVPAVKPWLARTGQQHPKIRWVEDRDIIAWDAAKAAWETLRTKPDDKDALRTVARFRCFVQGFWDDGLALARELPAGADDPLRELARLEAKAGVNPYEVADAWKAWSDAQTEKQAMAAGPRRMRMWYARQLNLSVGPEPMQRSTKGAEWKLHDDPEATSDPGLIQTIGINPEKTRIRKWDLTGKQLYAGLALKNNLVEARWSGRLIPPSTGRYHLLLDGDAVFCSGLAGDLDRAKDPNVRMEATWFLKVDEPKDFTVQFRVPSTEQARVSLKWVRPGRTESEVIPLDGAYHRRDKLKTND